MTGSIDKAALDLFKIYGVKKVSMDDIARRTGHCKKTIYERYGSKEEMIESVLNYLFEKLEIRLNYIGNQSSSTIGKLSKFYGEILRYCQSFHPVFLQSLKHFFPAQYAVYERQVDALVRGKIIPLYRQAKAEGIILPEMVEESIGELHTEFFHFLVFKAAQANVRGNTIETFKRRIWPSFRGLLTPAYISLFDNGRCQQKVNITNM